MTKSIDAKNELLAIIQDEIDNTKPSADAMAQEEGWENANDMRSHTETTAEFELGWLSALEYINEKRKG